MRQQPRLTRRQFNRCADVLAAPARIGTAGEITSMHVRQDPLNCTVVQRVAGRRHHWTIQRITMRRHPCHLPSRRLLTSSAVRRGRVVPKVPRSVTTRTPGAANADSLGPCPPPWPDHRSQFEHGCDDSSSISLPTCARIGWRRWAWRGQRSRSPIPGRFTCMSGPSADVSRRPIQSRRRHSEPQTCGGVSHQQHPAPGSRDIRTRSTRRRRRPLTAGVDGEEGRDHRSGCHAAHGSAAPSCTWIGTAPAVEGENHHLEHSSMSAASSGRTWTRRRSQRPPHRRRRRRRPMRRPSAHSTTEARPSEDPGSCRRFRQGAMTLRAVNYDRSLRAPADRSPRRDVDDDPRWARQGSDGERALAVESDRPGAHPFEVLDHP